MPLILERTANVVLDTLTPTPHTIALAGAVIAELCLENGDDAPNSSPSPTAPGRGPPPCCAASR